MLQHAPWRTSPYGVRFDRIAIDRPGLAAVFIRRSNAGCAAAMKIGSSIDWRTRSPPGITVWIACARRGSPRHSEGHQGRYKRGPATSEAVQHLKIDDPMFNGRVRVIGLGARSCCAIDREPTPRAAPCCRASSAMPSRSTAQIRHALAGQRGQHGPGSRPFRAAPP